ncbi:MAG: MFS transporter, partial [Planctomycetota bacterium]
MSSMPMSVRVRLSAMMFLQFLLFAVYWVPLAAYLSGNLGVTGAQMSLIMSTMALGCVMSPIIGMIADRHFASQKVLSVLNLLGTELLIWAANVINPMWVFIALLIQQLCYMPTWGLTSSIAMTHSPADKFPQIRVFGSIGWVASGIFGWTALKLFGVTI